MKRTVNLRDMSAANNGTVPAPAGNQEMQTRKILSDLQREKARLRMIQQGVVGPSTNPVRLPMNPPVVQPSAEPPQHLLSMQRSALQMAHTSSFGYFVPQDSAFVCRNMASFSPIKPVLGDRASLVRTFTQEDLLTFAKLTGDYNPLHLDPEFVRHTGVFEKPLVHAALLNGLVSGLLGTKLPGPGCVAVMESSRYPSPLYVGDTVRAEVVVTSIKKRFFDLAIECVNVSSDEGKKVMLGKVTVMKTKDIKG